MKIIVTIFFSILLNSTYGQDFSTIETIVNANLIKYNNNVVVWIKQNNQTIYKLEKGSFDTTSQQLIASCTKWLSGATMLSLEDDGLIALDDSIGKYLPIFTTFGKGAATIRECMSHTSGFPENSLQEYESNNTLTLEQAVDSIASNVNTLFNPGDKFNYGSVSMHICGRIAEIVTGKSWAALFKERIADKCQMTGTFYFPLKNPLIAGGGYSSPKDYMNFLQMILDDGVFNNIQVLSQNSVNELYKDQTNKTDVFYSPVLKNPFFPLDTFRYGIGDWQDEANVQISSPGLFGTYPWVDKCRNLTGIIFTFSALSLVLVPNVEIIKEVRTQIPSCDINGIKLKNENKNTISVFPNPAQNTLSINFLAKELKNEVIEIFDNLGRLKKVKRKGNIIDISSFGKGIYFLKIKNNVTTFIKE